MKKAGLIFVIFLGVILFISFAAGFSFFNDQDMACSADISGDGVVNYVDFMELRNHLGDLKKFYDVNGDDNVNIVDLLIVRNYFGSSCDTVCFDSDGPDNFNVKGYVKEGGHVYWDDCYKYLKIDYAIDYKCLVNGSYSAATKVCKYGCEDGVCLSGPVCEGEEGDLYYNCNIPLYGLEDCRQKGLNYYVDRNYTDVSFKCCKANSGSFSDWWDCYFVGVAPVINQTNYTYSSN